MSSEEKLNLYNKAKEAYYNGNPIMDDKNFDELEIELGLENKSDIGTAHNPTYTVKHPYMMGSLSKIQIHQSKDGNIDWEKYEQEISSYIKKGNRVIVTPKYDGCSFEMVVRRLDLHNYEVVSVSGRGDGQYGKDLSRHLKKQVDGILKDINIYLYNICDILILRGEILIPKDIFERKYSEYVNPRSFVSGLIGSEYDENDKELIDKLSDLNLIIYHYKKYEEELEEYYDDDFTSLYEVLSEQNYPDKVYELIWGEETGNIESIYRDFEDYRNSCNYAMDGIVISTAECHRLLDLTSQRPKDCIAIKFIPMVAETTVTDIEWNLGKSGEYIPNVRFEPVKMDGKMVSKANGFNYGYLMENKISIGTKIIVSLAGDIIPYIYKISDSSKFNRFNMGTMPLSFEVVNDVHMMAILSREEEENNRLYYSILSLKIPGCGPEIARSIIEYYRIPNFSDDMISDFFGNIPIQKEFPNNVFYIRPDDMREIIGGKNGQKISTAYKKILKSIDLKTIIKTWQFQQCGDRCAEECTRHILGQNAEFLGLPSIGYGWALDLEHPSENLQNIYDTLDFLGISLDAWKSDNSNIEDDKIPIIMTGEPNEYSSKAEFLRLHPEYRNTGSWKEVKIVFTNSLESSTGKMKKAREKGIEIRLY